MKSKKVIISACLIGYLCRYDGKTKESHGLLEAFEGYEIIPFCPEAPLFGTPRERISIIEIDGINRIVSDETLRDVTQELIYEINTFIALHPDAEAIVLKSKSPSCGLGTTAILNKQREHIGYGNGIAAEMFLAHYTFSKISDESPYL